MKTVTFIAVVALATPLWALSETLNTIGIVEAKPNSYPYNIAVRVGYSIQEEELCDGTLISKEWIITAADCTRGAIFVVGGAHSIHDQESTKRSLQISRIIQHPNYDEKEKRNNLALLKVYDNLDENEFVKPVGLPKLSQKDMSFESSPVTVSGWGRNYISFYDMKTLLVQEVRSQVVSNDNCQRQYNTNNIEQSHLCVAGYPGKQNRFGDGGAPVVIDEDGRKILIGIGSYNNNKESSPVVFTRITSYLKWIHDVTGIAVEW